MYRQLEVGPGVLEALTILGISRDKSKRAVLRNLDHGDDRMINSKKGLERLSAEIFDEKRVRPIFHELSHKTKRTLRDLKN